MSKKGISESGVVACTNLTTVGREEQSSRKLQKEELEGLQRIKIKDETSQGKLEQ